ALVSPPDNRRRVPLRGGPAMLTRCRLTGVIGSPPRSPRSSARGFPLAVASCRRAALRCSLAVGSRSLLLASALAPLLARSSLRCSLAVGSRSLLLASALPPLLAPSSLRCSLAVRSP